MSKHKRIHHIIFNLHTVSSIVISVVLYIIFFAGSFSFFRDEIVNWERGHSTTVKEELSMNVDSAIAHLSRKYELYGRDISLTHYYNERRVGINLTGSRDSTASETAKVGAFFYVDTQDQSTTTYFESYTLGEFLYRLHFFAQIPYPYGYLMSGFVAFFFLFAILTGIIVHWNKIISNFYVFRPMSTLKALWTDAHTALGLIGVPFQLVYALTGAYFMIQGVLAAPYIYALYQGDEQQFNEEMGNGTVTYPLTYDSAYLQTPISPLVQQTKAQWQGFKITSIQIANFGDASMRVKMEGHLPHQVKMTGHGKVEYVIANGQREIIKNPLQEAAYFDVVKNLLYRLHLADYAGLALRVVSFILGLLSCFVILSGVMIWLVARNKRNIPARQRRFNEGIVHWYLAICLSMYPMIAGEFLLVKLFSPAGITFLYQTFFSGWLLLSIFFALVKDNIFTLRWTLLGGGVLGILSPFFNGIFSGYWLWTSYRENLNDMLLVDMLWIILSVISIGTAVKLTESESMVKATGSYSGNVQEIGKEAGP